MASYIAPRQNPVVHSLHAAPPASHASTWTYHPISIQQGYVPSISTAVPPRAQERTGVQPSQPLNKTRPYFTDRGARPRNTPHDSAASRYVTHAYSQHDEGLRGYPNQQIPSHQFVVQRGPARVPGDAMPTSAVLPVEALNETAERLVKLMGSQEAKLMGSQEATKLELDALRAAFTTHTNTLTKLADEFTKLIERGLETRKYFDSAAETLTQLVNLLTKSSEGGQPATSKSADATDRVIELMKPLIEEIIAGKQVTLQRAEQGTSSKTLFTDAPQRKISSIHDAAVSLESGAEFAKCGGDQGGGDERCEEVVALCTRRPGRILRPRKPTIYKE